jgi:hypothetical protein
VTVGNDEWDALERYLRTGAVPAVEAERAEDLQRLAAVTRTTSVDEMTS